MISLAIGYHGDNLGYSMVDVLDVIISRRVVGDCGELLDAKNILDSVESFGQNRKPSSERNVVGHLQRRV